ncbi:hypothetical protein vBAbaPP1_174 [Acinetobacter phage vB_AbaM_P1]|nr:hypothetical protein vBAbaPP1_174 [Acinetobacter phage vB_AbaM_P1]WAX22656.1 hypothetical protein [Acinetobacter phage vB_AbaP_HB01]
MELIKNATVVKLSLGSVEEEYGANDVIGQLVYSKFEELMDRFIHFNSKDCWIGTEYTIIAQNDVIVSALEEVHFQCVVLHTYVLDVKSNAETMNNENDERIDYLYDSIRKGTFAQDLHNLDYSDLDLIKSGLKQAEDWITKLIVFIGELKEC